MPHRPPGGGGQVEGVQQLARAAARAYPGEAEEAGHEHQVLEAAEILVDETTGETRRFTLDHTEGLRSHYSAGQRFDSDVERTLVQKWERSNTEWELVREDDVFDLGAEVMIPDFAIEHPDGRRAILEIVGFWTPEYLDAKLEKIRQVEADNFVLAVSERLDCANEEFGQAADRGGPGVGPICAADHLAPFLPGHPLVETGGEKGIPAVSQAPYGSALILLISWAYIKLLGTDGLTEATKTAVLNANYVAKRLSEHYDIVYSGKDGRVAHEFILDLREVRRDPGINEQDVAKRLMDYGFHAPTMSWPVVGTLMVEPTESESKAELDRFCEALASIRAEIAEVERGTVDAEASVLRQAPHTAEMVTADEWTHVYPRSTAAYPTDDTRDRKFWPSVRRVDDAYGDRNLVCACPPMEAYAASGDEDELKAALSG